MSFRRTPSEKKLSFVVVDSAGLAPYAAGLRAIEKSISYPIADGQDSFHIDHGPLYHPFFSSMGKARFLVALEGETVIGSLTAVWRELDAGGKRYTGLYFCDLKLTQAWRGRGLVRRMLWHVFVRWPFRRDFQGWSFVFFAAMRGDRGDVGRSFRGWHLGRILRPIGRLALYFVPLPQLSQLPEEAPVTPRSTGLNFSPNNVNKWQSTQGSKDFQLLSTGRAWPLVHLPQPPQATDQWGQYLRATSSRLLIDCPDAIACFGVDERFAAHIEWLSQQRLERGASCLLYCFSIPFAGPRLSGWAWTHLATSEI